MELTRLIEGLSRPAAYPHPYRDVEIHHTHISVVFLVHEWAYKLKKPLDLGFLDFTTPEKRLAACRAEVRLNRRLAPEVYVGVVPITAGEEGVRVDGGGPVVEHAVKMRRLPPEARLVAWLERGRLCPEHLRRLAVRLAAFHAAAKAGPQVSRWGRFEVVAGNARENLEEARLRVGETISGPVCRRLERRVEEALAAGRELIEARAAAAVPRDTHGDLHLEHVYLFPDREPPRDVVAIDCIEFNERFRYADPVADIAFLTMDLRFHGRPDLAEAFAEAYVEAAEDPEGRRLLPFYESYRAAVRGKVEGLIPDEEEVPAEERREAVRRSRAHWLLALSRLEPPARRPCLVLVGGLPGTGKSTLAEGLEQGAGFTLLSSDRTRKALAGLAPGAPAAAAFGEGLYTPSWNDRTYEALAERAAEALFRGERVLVDASFREEARRRRLLREAERLRLPALLLVCEASPEVVRERLAARASGPSDADVAVYERAAETWEELGEGTAGRGRRIDAGGSPEAALGQARTYLREAELL